MAPIVGKMPWVKVGRIRPFIPLEWRYYFHCFICSAHPSPPSPGHGGPPQWSTFHRAEEQVRAPGGRVHPPAQHSHQPAHHRSDQATTSTISNLLDCICYFPVAGFLTLSVFEPSPYRIRAGGSQHGLGPPASWYPHTSPLTSFSPLAPLTSPKGHLLLHFTGASHPCFY